MMSCQDFIMSDQDFHDDRSWFFIMNGQNFHDNKSRFYYEQRSCSRGHVETLS